MKTAASLLRPLNAIIVATAAGSQCFPRVRLRRVLKARTKLGLAPVLGLCQWEGKLRDGRVSAGVTWSSLAKWLATCENRAVPLSLPMSPPYVSGCEGRLKKRTLHSMDHVLMSGGLYEHSYGSNLP